MSISIRKLGEQDLAIAKSFADWAENNDTRVIVGLMRNRITDVFVVIDDGKAIGVFNVSYKVTALGDDIVNDCVHIHSVFGCEFVPRADIVRIAIRGLGRTHIPDAYTRIVVSIKSSDEDMISVVESEGINKTIGSIDFVRANGVERKVILMGMRNGARAQ